MITITTTIKEKREEESSKVFVTSNGASDEKGATPLEAKTAEVLIVKLVKAVKDTMSETGGIHYKETPATIIQRQI